MLERCDVFEPQHIIRELGESGGGQLALLEQIRPATRALLGEAFGLQGSTSTTTGPAPVDQGRFGADASDMVVDSTVEVVVAFESEPSGATVRLDGALLCQTTPCSKRVAEGPHEVVFEKERYAATTLNAVAKKGASVRGRLVPTFGVVTVQTEPSAVAVTMNGENVGRSPVRREVVAGPLEVVVDDRCFLRAGERLNVKAGDERTVALPLKPRQAAVKVAARDKAGNDVEGEGVVDVVAVGEVGAALRVPVCGKELTVRGAAGEWMARWRKRRGPRRWSWCWGAAQARRGSSPDRNYAGVDARRQLLLRLRASRYAMRRRRDAGPD